MQPAVFYTERITELDLQLQSLLKKKSALAWLRFATVISMGACWYFLYPAGLYYALIPTFILLIVFTRLIFSDLNNKSVIEHTKHLITVNEDELKALNHQYYHFEDGAGYLPKEHYYANDLDIFGRASLFQYINRTKSEMGGKTLADWLLAPADSTTITQRQQAVKELNSVSNWRQTLQAYGAAKKIQTATQERLQIWFKQENSFINNKLWLLLRYLVPAIVLTVVFLNIADVVSNYFRNYVLFGSVLMALYMWKRVAPLHQQVSKITEELDVLTESIRLIEESSFKSDYLLQLQKQFASENGKASAKLYQLKKILERLDIRFNIVVFIPLDILLQWDLQQAMALEKWKQQNHENVMAWFTALGEFEAVASLSTLSFNHPGWCFPEIRKEHFSVEGKEIGHPLIPAGKCVNNPININKTGELMLVTGSNMAGKSTYLRSIGINTVLGMAGAPVCAKAFSISPVQVISSMRIADNLEESTSTFYAELKKLKTVIDKVNNNEKVFILLDEILRGTNSLDRHTGSAALIKQLIKHDAAGIIATHDVELADIKKEYPANILNYHFDVQVNNEELYFDYKLKEGICTSLNASILMRKIGIEL